MKKQFVFFCLFILALQVHAQDSLIVKTDSIVVSEVLSPQPIDTNISFIRILLNKYSNPH